MSIARSSVQVLLLALASFGQSSHDEPLRLKAKDGDVRLMKLTADFVSSEVSLKLTADLSRRILHAEPNGPITVEESRKNIAIVMNENHLSAPDTLLIRVYNPDGTTMALRGDEGTGPDAYRATTLTTVKLPDFGLAVDKTWTWKVAADAKTGVVDASADYKVVASERVHDIDAWKINFEVKESGDSPASSKSTAWISKVDGAVIRIESSVKNLPLKGVGPLSGTQTLDLVVN